MSLIYEPKGAAREYSPLALNVYTQGCEHQCSYCYCANIGTWGTSPKPRNLTGLHKDALEADRQVMLSFMGDAYCPSETTYRKTREALRVLEFAGCTTAILSKGGSRCLDDLEQFKRWPGGRFKVGATLTFLTDALSAEVEPGAASPTERLETLKTLHDNGVVTWASIEPVINAKESLAVISATLPFVDAYKVGKMNHRVSSVNWSSFCVDAVNLIRSAGRKLYVKHDLRPFAPAGFLFAEECDPEVLFLPDRPKEKLLI